MVLVSAKEVLGFLTQVQVDMLIVIVIVMDGVELQLSPAFTL